MDGLWGNLYLQAWRGLPVLQFPGGSAEELKRHRVCKDAPREA